MFVFLTQVNFFLKTAKMSVVHEYLVLKNTDMIQQHQNIRLKSFFTFFFLLFFHFCYFNNNSFQTELTLLIYFGFHT